MKMKFIFKLLYSDCIGCGEVTNKKHHFSKDNIEYIVPFCIQCYVKRINPEEIIFNYHDYDNSIHKYQTILNSLKEKPERKQKEKPERKQKEKLIKIKLKTNFNKNCEKCGKLYDKIHLKGPRYCLVCFEKEYPHTPYPKGK
jgi:hypothetical protein